MRTMFLAAGLLVGGIASAHAEIYNAQVAIEAWQTVAQVERENAIPRGLLHSMSLVETGQGVEGHVLPWPYTVGINPTATYKFDVASKGLKKLDKLRRVGFKKFNVKVGLKSYNGVDAQHVEKLFLENPEEKLRLKGMHFSKRFHDAHAASRFVHHSLAQGYDNLDVGLLQINWHYHSEQFASVADAFDPAQNAGYAVSYLTKHRQEKSWWNSVGRYHSGTKKYAEAYIRSVYAMYRRVHRLKDNA